MASLGTSVLDAQPRDIVGQPADAAVSCSRPMRIAVVVNQIPPYYVRLFQELSDTPGWDLKVFTFVDREVDRQ